MHRFVVLIIVLLLASLACTFSTPTPAPTEAPAPLPPTNTAVPATETPTPVTPEGTEAPTGEPSASPEAAQTIPVEIAMQMNAIQEQVIDLRGLEPTSDVPRALLSPDELRQRVVDDFVADYTPEEAVDDVIELAALGLLEPGFDLRSFYIELFSEQIAGFYDQEVDEMYVVQGEGFFGSERLTYAHEYTHVLQDQTYDIEEGLDYTEESCEADSERCAAIQALIEGDATLSGYSWFLEYATQEDRESLLATYENYESPVYDSAPPFMHEDFMFPYTAGLTFVQALYDEGGWPAVDRAYGDVPVSTEQILHPERYPEDTPIPVELPDLLPALGADWRELDRNVMGEWYTYLILGFGIDPQAQVAAEVAAEAAAGWGGDSYLIYVNDTTGQTVVVLSTLWESASEAGQFAAAFRTYADARYGVIARSEAGSLIWNYSGGYALFQQDGAATLWVQAPDAATAQTVLTALQAP